MKDIDEIRRENLRALGDEYGGTTALAKVVGMSTAQLSGLQTGARSSKTGKRLGMLSTTARRIERATGKPPRWLDMEHAGLMGVSTESPVHYQIADVVSSLTPRKQEIIWSLAQALKDEQNINKIE